MTVEQNPKEKKNTEAFFGQLKLRLRKNRRLVAEMSFFVVVEGGKGGTQPVACQLLLS